MNISLSGRRRLGVLTAVRISTANAQVSTNGVHSRMVDKPEVIQKRVLGNFGGNGPKSLGRINPPIAEVGPFLTRFSTQNWILSAEGSVDILATSLKFERTIDRQRGFLWRQEVRWPKSDSCLLPASLCKSPGRCSRATEAVSANVNLPSRSCWPFSA